MTTATSTPEDRRMLDTVRTLYTDIRRGAAEGFAIPQLEQNDAHLSAAHYTPLGSIDRRSRVLQEILAGPPEQTAGS